MESDLIMIEVRQARYFVAVAEELHFGRAAARLAMSQPPLSQAIRQLERQLGVELLVRSSRSVKLTETGRLFLTECRSLILAAERAGDAALGAAAGRQGRLRIAAVASAFTTVLPEIFERLRRARPQVDLRIREIDTQHAVDALARREIDIAVVRQSSDGAQYDSLPLRQDRFVLAAPSGYVTVGPSESVDLADYSDVEWVWLPRDISPGYHDEMVMACRRAGFSPEGTHFANSIRSQLAIVACGTGIALVPHSSAQAAPGVEFHELADRADLVELSLLRRRGVHEILVDQFVDCAMPTASQ